MCCVRHGLLLKGVHTAETTNGLLIKRDSFTGISTRFILLNKGLKSVEQQGSVIGDISHCHESPLSST